MFTFFFSLTFLVFPVNNLLNTIPSLTNKISTVENLTSQVSPINNISENIKMLKDLIEQARDAANKVRLFCKYSYGFSSLAKVKYTCSLYNIFTSRASFFLFFPCVLYRLQSL